MDVYSPSSWKDKQDINTKIFVGGGLLQPLFDQNVFGALPRSFPELPFPSEQFFAFPRSTITHQGILNAINLLFSLKSKKRRNELSSLITFASENNIRAEQEWRRLSYTQIQKISKSWHGFSHLLNKYLPSPTFHHHCLSSGPTKKSSQRQLNQAIQSTLLKSRFVEDFLLPNQEDWIELDLYYQDLALGLEYQGMQHYVDIGAFGPSAERDGVKKILCSSFGITLLSIPYWWDRKLFFLEDIVGKNRPDLLRESKREIMKRKRVMR